MTRSDILDAAKEIVTKDRNKQYGEPEDNFEKVAILWNAYMDCAISKDFSIEDVGIMMILFKIARAIDGCSIDNYIDIAGYAACTGELLSEEDT